jgi:hemophore-related protein
MKTRGIAILGGVGIVSAGIAVAPLANAAPCSAASATGTIGSVSLATSQYLVAHPGADQTLSNAIVQSPQDARDSVRAYFTAHPDEYLALKGITRPLIDLQNQCGTVGLPANLIDAFNEFQAG